MPAGGFGGFGFKFGNRFDRVAGRREFGVAGIEFEGGVFGAGQGAISFFVEAGREGAEGVGQDNVVLGIGLVDGEAGFEGGVGGEHGGGFGIYDL